MSLRYSAPFFSVLFLSHCFPGGIIEKGGHVFAPAFLAEATRTGRAPYLILCPDQTGNEPSETDENSPPPVRTVSPEEYTGGCEQVGESSTFYLFHLFAVSPPLDPEYAIFSAVHRLEGDTMIHVTLWHEVHYYSILGKASVMKVKGDVIRYANGVNKK